MHKGVRTWSGMRRIWNHCEGGLGLWCVLASNFGEYQRRGYTKPNYKLDKMVIWPVSKERGHQALLRASQNGYVAHMGHEWPLGDLRASYVLELAKINNPNGYDLPFVPHVKSIGCKYRGSQHTTTNVGWDIILLRRWFVGSLRMQLIEYFAKGWTWEPWVHQRQHRSLEGGLFIGYLNDVHGSIWKWNPCVREFHREKQMYVY